MRLPPHHPITIWRGVKASYIIKENFKKSRKFVFHDFYSVYQHVLGLFPSYYFRKYKHVTNDAMTQLKWQNRDFSLPVTPGAHCDLHIKIIR
jgi:hypothetical protein